MLPPVDTAFRHHAVDVVSLFTARVGTMCEVSGACEALLVRAFFLVQRA